jgi:hypothetical protein
MLLCHSEPLAKNDSFCVLRSKVADRDLKRNERVIFIASLP